MLKCRGVLHSRNVVDGFRNLFGNVQKFIEICRNLEIRTTFKAKFDWFCGARNPLCERFARISDTFVINIRCPIQDARIKVILTIISAICIINTLWYKFIHCP